MTLLLQVPPSPGETIPPVRQTPLPIALLNIDKLTPTTYRIFLKSQRCRNCGTLHEYSETYLHHRIPSRWGMGQVEHLVPLRDPSFHYNVPISKSILPLQEVPMCSECYDTVSLSHLSTPSPEANRTILNTPKIPIAETKGKKSADTLLDELF